jgi:hypothetical protein
LQTATEHGSISDEIPSIAPIPPNLESISLSNVAMVLLDLLTLTAIPTAVGASDAVHQQRALDKEAESEERQTPFYLDVFCDAQSRKRDEVHDAIVVLKDEKVHDRAPKLFFEPLTLTPIVTVVA